MGPILRSVGALLLGAVTTFLLIMLLEGVSHVVYPPPANLDACDEARPPGVPLGVEAAGGLGSCFAEVASLCPIVQP